MLNSPTGLKVTLKLSYLLCYASNREVKWQLREISKQNNHNHREKFKPLHTWKSIYTSISYIIIVNPFKQTIYFLEATLWMDKEMNLFLEQRKWYSELLLNLLLLEREKRTLPRINVYYKIDSRLHIVAQTTYCKLHFIAHWEKSSSSPSLCI